MTAQQLHADRMKRAKPRHPLNLLTQHTTHTVLHLAGGFVGKGHRQNLVRTGASCVHQMDNAGGQSLGFTGPRPRKHQDRAIHLLNGGALGWVQAIQIGLRTRGHSTRRQRCAVEGVHFIEIIHGNKPSPKYGKGKPHWPKDVHTPFRTLFLPNKLQARPPQTGGEKPLAMSYGHMQPRGLKYIYELAQHIPRHLRFARRREETHPIVRLGVLR